MRSLTLLILTLASCVSRGDLDAAKREALSNRLDVEECKKALTQANEALTKGIAAVSERQSEVVALARAAGVKGVNAAPTMMRRLCDAGDGQICFAIAEALDDEKGDPAAITRAYKRACDGGFAAGCGSFGVRLVMGEGIEKSIPEGRAFLQRGCEGRSAKSCGDLGRVFQHGYGGGTDIVKAAALYSLACETNHAPSCNDVGVIYAKGIGTRVNKIKAREYFNRACDGGDELGCKNLRATR